MHNHVLQKLLSFTIANLAAISFLYWLLSTAARPVLPIDDDPLAYQSEAPASLHPVFRDGRWGYVDNQGRMVISPRFSSAMDFFENRAAVVISKPQKAGFIRPDGSWSTLVPEHGIPLGHFSEGRAWFLQAGFYGCVDREGNVRIPPTYQSAQEFSSGLARVGFAEAVYRRKPAQGEKRGEVEKKWIWTYGFVDRFGNEILPLQFAHATPFVDGLAQTCRPGSPDYNFINRVGEIVFSLARTSPGSTDQPGLATGFSGGRASAFYYGSGSRAFVRFFDTSGHQVGPDAPYDWSGQFFEGLAHVCNSEHRFGFIDTNGQLLIAPSFEDAGDFHEGRCRVRAAGTWQFIDATGAVVAQGSPAEPWNDAEDFHDGLARVHSRGEFNDSEDHASRWWSGGKWLYVDRSGSVLTVCRTDGTDPIEPPLGHESSHGKHRLSGKP